MPRLMRFKILNKCIYVLRRKKAIFFKMAEIAKILGYRNATCAIRQSKSIFYRFKLKDLDFTSKFVPSHSLFSTIYGVIHITREARKSAEFKECVMEKLHNISLYVEYKFMREKCQSSIDWHHTQSSIRQEPLTTASVDSLFTEVVPPMTPPSASIEDTTTVSRACQTDMLKTTEKGVQVSLA